MALGCEIILQPPSSRCENAHRLRNDFAASSPSLRNTLLAHECHSELCFDTAIFKLQLELRDSFHLLQRYHMEYLLTPRDFFYPAWHWTFISP